MELEDFLHCSFEVGYHKIVMIIANPWRFDHEGGASGHLGGLGVLTLVADDKGMVQIKGPLERSLDEQARVWLAARMGGIVVGADENVIDGKLVAQDEIGRAHV